MDTFAIEPVPVTNERFAAFVSATGYVTVSERPVDPHDFPDAPPENLVPGSLVFTPTPVRSTCGARGGLEGAEYTWGDEVRPDGRIMANTWDGPDFPWRSTQESGYTRTSPVGSFPANGFGLYDMAGNVWEWTDDWWTSHPQDAESPCCVPVNPRGGDLEHSYDAGQPKFRVGRKVIKGGSHLCADSYCLRYRPAARRPQMVDTGMSHIGFRCVRRAASDA